VFKILFKECSLIEKGSKHNFFSNERNSRDEKKTFSWTFLVFTLKKQTTSREFFFKLEYLAILKIQGSI